MSRIFNVSESKQKRGFCWPVILPAKTGKTRSIIYSMEARDICISPYYFAKDFFESRLIKEKASYMNSHTWLASDKGKMHISFKLNIRALNPEFFSRYYNTIFVDEFLFYNNSEIEDFIKPALQISNNVIMISSDSYQGGIPEFLQNKKNIYYDEIKIGRSISKYVSLPEKLFVL